MSYDNAVFAIEEAIFAYDPEELVDYNHVDDIANRVVDELISATQEVEALVAEARA